MIKNAAVVLGVGLALASGCARPAPEADLYQGVLEYQERDLAFELTGRLTELQVHEGDRLAAGALIARIAPDVEQSTLAARESEARAAQQQLLLLRAGTRPEDVDALAARLDAARANEALMRTSAERTRKLVAAQAAPQATLDEAQAQLLRAQAETRAAAEALRAARRGSRVQEIAAAQDRVAAAQASTDVQRQRLSRFELRALDPGEVLEVHLRPGELALAGLPVVTVADTVHPYADVFVPQGSIGGVAVGAPAEARVDSLPHPVSGRVERISRRTEFSPRYLFSRTERATLVIRVRVRFDDPGRELHAGVPVFVRVTGAGAATRSDGDAGSVP
ncbi:MAG TPA: HlyD family efflux transporter periplasmic adaptor subunit [Polyangia bacterium]|nr:HlyD family efflux transporter periplasmic adaptor subunit [Polyangia bacterium]